MTDERFNRLLETVPGTGVKVTYADGGENNFFYEDFDGPATGVKRAMAHLYPLHDKGIVKTMCFIEHANYAALTREREQQREAAAAEQVQEQAGPEQSPGLTM